MKVINFVRNPMLQKKKEKFYCRFRVPYKIQAIKKEVMENCASNDIVKLRKIMVHKVHCLFFSTETTQREHDSFERTVHETSQ